MKALGWLRDYWYVPLFLVGAVAMLLLRCSKTPLSAQLDTELHVIQAGAVARKMKALVGAQQAADEVRKHHAAVLQRLTEEQARQAEALRNDPVALSKFLVRAAAGST